MSEHKRLKHKFTGEIYQWVDESLYMVIDSVTGEPIRFGRRRNSVGTYEEAMEHIEERSTGVVERDIIVKMDCIVARLVGFQSKGHE